MSTNNTVTVSNFLTPVSAECATALYKITKHQHYKAVVNELLDIEALLKLIAYTPIQDNPPARLIPKSFSITPPPHNIIKSRHVSFSLNRKTIYTHKIEAKGFVQYTVRIKTLNSHRPLPDLLQHYALSAMLNPDTLTFEPLQDYLFYLTLYKLVRDRIDAERIDTSQLSILGGGDFKPYLV